MAWDQNAAQLLDVGELEYLADAHAGFGSRKLAVTEQAQAGVTQEAAQQKNQIKRSE